MECGSTPAAFQGRAGHGRLCVNVLVSSGDPYIIAMC